MDNIPCKHFRSWYENQAPLGSGRYWPEYFEECCHPEFDDPVKEKAFRYYADNCRCGKDCPGYEPVEIAVCPKHGEYIKRDGCEECRYGGD